MTATATRVEPDAAATPTPADEITLARSTTTTTRPTTPTDGILATLRAALEALAEVDPDALDSRAAIGRATVPLAGTARSAVAALGGDPGLVLTHAPGVVVGRDLVMATNLLATTARSRTASGGTAARRLAQLALDADRRLAELRAQLGEAVTRRA